MHYLLMYDVVHDYVERRTQYRSEHIGLAREADVFLSLIHI